MSNRKQTAVDWLEYHINIGLTYEQQIIFEGLFQQAKEIEKEQITEGFKKGLQYWNGDAWELIDIEQYYKETYETSH